MTHCDLSNRSSGYSANLTHNSKVPRFFLACAKKRFETIRCASRDDAKIAQLRRFIARANKGAMLGPGVDPLIRTLRGVCNMRLREFVGAPKRAAGLFIGRAWALGSCVAHSGESSERCEACNERAVTEVSKCDCQRPVPQGCEIRKIVCRVTGRSKK